MISVGPVQELIAAGRKLRDLWFGSHLLSELSKAVARELDSQGAVMVFPSPAENEQLKAKSNLSVANKILAVLPAGIDPAEVVKELRVAWRREWNGYAETALENARRKGGVKVDEDLFWAQIDDLGEFYASWMPLTSEDTYKCTRDRLEVLLSGRKSLRGFEAPSWVGAGLRKSSLDGSREAVIPEKTDERKGFLKQGELLDALGIIKRFSPVADKRTPHFDDLSELALIPWLHCVNFVDAKAELEAAENEIISQYPDSKRADPRQVGPLKLRIYPEYLFDKGLANLPKKIRHDLLGKVKNESPDPYTCILVGDGDKMGDALDRLSTRVQHQEFSRHLGDFASEVEGVVSKHEGSMIYSGGDDVMAYLPLHTALEGVAEIRQTFMARMTACRDELEIDFPIPTFSLGLAIVHYIEPLSLSLAYARSAEQNAKKIGGRDALSIILKRRSGGETEIHGKWEDKFGGIVQRLNKMGTIHASGDLPATLAYQLREIEKKCGGNLTFERVNTGKMFPKNAASALTKRLIAHKDSTSEGSNLGHSLVDDILPDDGNIRSFSNMLIIARVFATAKQLANTPSKGGTQ